jgi:hypothetical protein
MAKSQERNLNPRPNAVFAMYHWPHDYAEQRGGVMDFFDTLHPADQEFCNRAVSAIIGAGIAWGVRVKEGKEIQRKPAPRLKKRRAIGGRHREP